MDRLNKLDNGTQTARWAADKIRELEIRLHRIKGILNGGVMYEYSDVEEMRKLSDTAIFKLTYFTEKEYEEYYEDFLDDDGI